MLFITKLCKNPIILKQLRNNLQLRNFTSNSNSKTKFNLLLREHNTLFRNVTKYKVNNFFTNSLNIRLFSKLKLSSSSKNQKFTGYWLLTCSGMVFIAVVLGGVTRLTESGLSMVTWKLLGEKMPRNENEWLEEFEKYKQYPEYKIKNNDITLSEFKWIWYMEYGHRMWGRAIGAIYFIPATILWATGSLQPFMKPRIIALGTLIAAQGLMGWYMVKSGLEDRFHGDNDYPRVSQYRLAAHLSLAFILYTLFLWSSLDHLLPAKDILSNCSLETIKAAKKFRFLTHSIKGLIFLTAISGAFVAGLDAGLVYNSFPKMANKWIPDDIAYLKPKILNLTENPTTVQFNHRILGTTTLIAITTLWLLSKKTILPSRAYKAVNILLICGWMQATLGITTLLHYVPTHLAASHQSGSLLLLSSAVWLAHELKKVPK